MKEVVIAPQTHFEIKSNLCVDLLVSEKNLVSFEEIEKLICNYISSLNLLKIRIYILFCAAGDRMKVQIEIKSGEDSDLLNVLDLFTHFLGNVKVYYKKIEYNVK